MNTDHARKLIRDNADNAMLMCSFGKDSMVLLHLIRETLPELPPIVYHRHPWFQFKNAFADEVIKSWGLEVYDYPPLACGVKAKPDRLELVARYPMGRGGIDIPLNTESPIQRRNFVCGLKWLLRPKISGLQWLWKNVFVGHKSSDVDPYEGQVPLRYDTVETHGIKAVFPLRHWTDDDIWDYIERCRVPYDKRRYAGRLEVPDKWLNPDYLHACTACIDPRETRKEVTCPKTGKMVPSVGNRVLRLEALPDYIEKERQVA